MLSLRVLLCCVLLVLLKGMACNFKSKGCLISIEPMKRIFRCDLYCFFYIQFLKNDSRCAMEIMFMPPIRQQCIHLGKGCIWLGMTDRTLWNDRIAAFQRSLYPRTERGNPPPNPNSLPKFIFQIYLNSMHPLSKSIGYLPRLASALYHQSTRNMI